MAAASLLSPAAPSSPTALAALVAVQRAEETRAYTSYAIALEHRGNDGKDKHGNIIDVYLCTVKSAATQV
jgi:hypothetical protein